MNLKKIKEKLKKGSAINIFGYKIFVKINKTSGGKKLFTQQHSPKQDDIFINDFRFNMYVDSNLDNNVKRNIIAQLFYKNVGYYPNIDNPSTLSEKVLWLKLYYNDPLISIACDKAAMKEYVDKVLGTGYTVPIIKKYKSVFDINFDELPNKFALKVNWATGCNVIVRDKTKINKDRILCDLDRWMLPWKSSYYGSFNCGYHGMKPVVFAEEYLDIPNNSTEYKVFCFNGKVKFVLVELDYFGKKPKRAYYNKAWQEMPFQFGNIEKVKIDNPPETYSKIIELAERLAKPFPYIRVDFYDIKGNLYIGEMTFYSGGGFSKIKPYDYDVELGKDLDLTEAMEKVKKGVL